MSIPPPPAAPKLLAVVSFRVPDFERFSGSLASAVEQVELGSTGKGVVTGGSHHPRCAADPPFGCCMPELGRKGACILLSEAPTLVRS